MARPHEGKGAIAPRTGVRRKAVTASLLCAALLMWFPAWVAAEPTRLAVFDFEFEDFSAGAAPSGAAPSGETPSDRMQLTSVSDEVRRLLAQSGRYRLVDVGNADAPAVRAHALRDCNGCDAAIALKLDAEQSLVGVVKRISRTEYTVRFQIRDARSGAVVSAADSGLRMGADYSWSRGAVRLIEDRLLQSPAQP